MSVHDAARAAATDPGGASRPTLSLHPSTRRSQREAERKRLAAERAGSVLKADGLLRLPEVLALVPVSASTWWEGIRSGRFPAGVKLGPRCTAWRAADIRGLLARLSAEGSA